MQDPVSPPVAQTKAFDDWKWPYLDNTVAREMINLAPHPVQHAEGQRQEVWPSIATSAKACGEIRRRFQGGVGVVDGIEEYTTVALSGFPNRRRRNVPKHTIGEEVYPVRQGCKYEGVPVSVRVGVGGLFLIVTQ